MPLEVILYGPPGTGKTTAGTTLARGWFGAGAHPCEVAYLGFTRAAAKAAATKIMESEDEVDASTLTERFPLFRTIHSLAYRGLKQAIPDAKVVTSTDMRRFSKSTGYEGAFAVSPWEDVAEALQKLDGGWRTHWDNALTAYTLSRISSSTGDELDRARVEMSRLATRTMGFLETSVYQTFVKRYEAFKQEEGLVDFTDMLAFALTSMPALDDCRYVIVDEAQDLCALHHAIVDRLFRSAEEVWWIGDDDQAIYRFAGASAELFLGRAHRASRQIQLRQTHRFGQGVVDFSAKIIRRVRGERVEKDIIGVHGKAGSIATAGEFRPVEGNVLILHRHVQGCQEVAKSYIEAGLPFINERGKDPLGAMNRMKAWAALDQLSKGGRVLFGSARLMVDELMPSVVVDDEVKTKTRLVIHGAKKRMEDATQSQVSLVDLFDGKILTEDGVRVIKTRGYQSLNHAADLEYYDRVSRNGYDVLDINPRKVPRITTIHGAKGRQAQSVVVFSEMGRRCWEDPDTEHRLAYVAATRTQGDLTVCAQRRVEWAASEYGYPVEETP